MDLREQIQAAIDKDLPKQVGDSLKKRLEEADETERKLELATSDIKEAIDKILYLKEKISVLEDLKIEKEDLDRKTKDLEKRENDLKITVLTSQLESEKEKSKFGFDVALGLVRNTEFRKSLSGFSHGPDLPPTIQGGYSTPQNSNNNSSETQTVS